MFFFQGCPSCQTSGTGSKNEWSLRSTKVETQQVSCFLRGFPMFFFVESLFYDFGDWRCLCIPMKGPVEWSVWSVAVSEARSNGVIEQELYHHDERHLENSCNLSTKSQKNGATYETFTVRITLANIAMISELRNKLVPSIFFWPKKTHSKHGFILRFQQFRDTTQDLKLHHDPTSIETQKAPPPPKLVFQLWTETTCWRFSSQIQMDCPMIAPKKDRSWTTKTVGTHLRYIDSIDLSLVGKTFYPLPRQKKQIFVDLPLHHKSAKVPKILTSQRKNSVKIWSREAAFNITRRMLLHLLILKITMRKFLLLRKKSSIQLHLWHDLWKGWIRIQRLSIQSLC